jgi:hopanoid biosynthesis associated RND transporter like protein HpnN
MARPLVAVTQWVLRVPRAVLAGAIVLAVLAILLAVSGLGFRTSRLDLLNPNSGYNKLWIDYIDEFGPDDDAVIVVEGSHRNEVLPVMDELSEALAREDQFFHSVLYEVDLSNIRSKGLYQIPLAEIGQLDRYLDQIEPVLDGDWSMVGLFPMLSGIKQRLAWARQAADEQQYAVAEGEAGRLIDSLHALLVSGQPYQSPWHHAGEALDKVGQLDSEYLLTNQGRWGIVLLKLRKSRDEFAQGTETIDVLRQLIADTQDNHPRVQIGLTGLPVMENDEMRASQRDMMRASIISLLGVGCLFAAGFGGIRHPLLTVVALLISMALCFGYITLSVGHLNILSVSFSVILIGLGIDFGVHYVARYLQLRATLPDARAALTGATASVGPGIVTGGVTTSIAFFAASFTEFTGVAELGIISGGGILLCIVGAVTVLPAMILLADGGRVKEPLPRPLAVDKWMGPLLQRPGRVMLGTLAVTGLLAAGAWWLRYDHNLLNLQPVGLESVELERRLLEETDQSVWFALSMSDSRDELLRRKQAFESLESVKGTEEILSWLPTNCEAKQPVIARIQRRLADLPECPPQIPVAEPAVLGQELAAVQPMLAGNRPASRAIRRRIDQIRDALRRLPPRDCLVLLSGYQQQLAGDLSTRLHLLHSVANPDPPQLSDLPSGLVSRFVGKSNRHLLKIYGRGNIWDMDDLERFVCDVKHIDPAATGQPLQTYYASRQMQQSYLLAALYALVAVSVVLLLDFQSTRCMLLALLPMALGLTQLLGVMGWLNVPLNPANLIVLPLILGIGIDDGVHVVHDFRRQRGRYRLSTSTAAAVLITSLTTMMGFGSLMLAGHRGLQSLGRVLTIGVCCCMVTSLVLLPAVLAWATRHSREENGQDDFPSDEGMHDQSEGRIRRVSGPHHRSDGRVPAQPAGPHQRPRRALSDPRKR